MRRARYRLMDRGFLDSIYHELNHPQEIGFDPIRYVLRFSSPRDQEVVGLIAAVLAYGHVKQISASMDTLSAVMGDQPAEWILNGHAERRSKALPVFQHRWTRREDILWLWERMHSVLNEYGSLEACFAEGILDETQAMSQGLSALVDALEGGDPHPPRMLSKPVNGSACKRMMMYLRWMIRRDDVDPGPWTTLEPSMLLMPVDTHIYRMAVHYRLTKRASVNWNTVKEISSHFQSLNPEDPVKYDFALTRLGMRGPDALDNAVQNYWRILP